MKKIFATLVLVASFAPVAAFAADCTLTNSCGGNGPVVPISTTWGAGAVFVPAGTVVTDFRGKTDTCAAWMGIMGCADIGHTAWYMVHVNFL